MQNNRNIIFVTNKNLFARIETNKITDQRKVTYF